MNGKFEDAPIPPHDTGIDIWRPFFHRQYETGFEGGIRRRYMELAKPPFYPKIFEVVDIQPGETVLDLGCGDGTDIIDLHERGHSGLIVGLETPVPENMNGTENKVEYIRQRLATGGVKNGPVENAELIIGYAEEMDFADESFDTIWAANTLQECYDIDRVLNNIFRMLVPGGKLIVITNHTGNKPFHHGELNNMAAEIGGLPPQPFSGKFNSITGPKVMARHRHQFRLMHEVIQEGLNNLRLTESEIPYLLASLATYFYDIRPKNMENISKDELINFLYELQAKRSGLLKEVERGVRARIDSSPDKAIYETIKRVGYLYKKRSKPAHLIMRSQFALKDYLQKN